MTPTRIRGACGILLAAAALATTTGCSYSDGNASAGVSEAASATAAAKKKLDEDTVVVTVSDVPAGQSKDASRWPRPRRNYALPRGGDRPMDHSPSPLNRPRRVASPSAAL
ncbi:hypothetical protein ACE1OC_34535 [Streptomyces sp. DSM 116496]|uniref:hypothetical protein n=1 Tax=Streptomyces stoeckheimensis TaxID=3344656 RepID=UPI0038B35E5A